MHAIMRKELKKQCLLNENMKGFQEEKLVELENGKKGAFDFFIECLDRKNIGFEVLARPSTGKLKDKLKYAPLVDKFVFVLPSDSFSFRRKPQEKVFFKEFIPKSFPSIFADKKLFVWLIDLKEKAVVRKALFSKVFSVKTSK